MAAVTFNPNTVNPQFHFSIPRNIIYYISMNPSSSTVYLKMINCCKYFYAKNKFLIIEEAQCYNSNGLSAVINEKSVCKIPDNINHRLWITDILSISHDNPKFISSFLFSKVEFCDISMLSLTDQNITWNEFLLLTSSKKVTNCNLSNVEIKNDKDESALFEDILQQLPSLNWFDYVRKHGDTCITPATVSKILNLPTFQNLEKFYIKNIPEIFDLENFKSFLESYKNTAFVIGFESSLSQDAVERLRKSAKKILGSGRKKVYIDF